MDRLNNTEPTIDFTCEQETKNILPFWNILQINNDNKVKFKLHHKSTNKNDYIYFYSHYKTKIKSGIIIGFYL